MAKANIWMPFYVADYLADTTRLTTEQHGAYILLILDYWRNGPPPNDPAVLAQITRMSVDAWSIASRTVLAFFEHRDGMLVHKRIDQEKVEANSNKDKKSARAKAAAEARWGKNAPSDAPSMPQALPTPCPSPSPSTSPNGEIKDIGAGAPGGVERRAEHLDAIEDVLSHDSAPAAKEPKFDAKAALLAEGLDAQAAVDFLQVRKAKKAPLNQTALDGLKREAVKACLPLASALAICCERGWQGFKAEWITSAPSRPNGRHSLNAIGEVGQGEADPFDNFRRG